MADPTPRAVQPKVEPTPRSMTPLAPPTPRAHTPTVRELDARQYTADDVRNVNGIHTASGTKGIK
jgi:hypothetical protein